MNTQPTVFAQIMAFLPMHEFRKCVRRYRGDYKVKRFSCLDQFLCLAFAQLTYRESLRDIVSCLQTMKNRLYHMGIRSNVSRNNLAHANERRDWRIYADFAHVLIAEARTLYRDEDIGLDLQNTVYAFDSTTIDLCLSLFPWAFFRKRKGAIKLHTLLDLRGSIPSFIHITEGKTHDVRILDVLPLEPGSFYILDRGYLDYSRLYTLHQGRAFFVTRAKSNLQSRRLRSRAVDKTMDLTSDQTIVLTGPKSKTEYPGAASSGAVLRSRKRSLPDLPVEQLSAARFDDRQTLQAPLAGGRVQPRTHDPAGESPAEANRLKAS